MFCSRRWLDITLAHLFTTTHSPVLSPLTPINYHKISHLAIPHTDKISDLVILPILIITNNTGPSRKFTIETMPTKKAPRKETGWLPKKSSVASLAAAAKRDPVVTVPSPPPKKGSNNKTAPSSSSPNQICKSHPKRLLQFNVEYRGNAVGTTSPLPSQQAVRNWGDPESLYCRRGKS